MKEFDPKNIIFARDKGVVKGEIRKIRGSVANHTGYTIASLVVTTRLVAKLGYLYARAPDIYDLEHRFTDLKPGEKRFFEDEGPISHQVNFGDMTISREGQPDMVYKPALNEQVMGNSLYKQLKAEMYAFGYRLLPARFRRTKTTIPSHIPGHK